ncbi:cupin domain-containing protein [Pseudonocardia thermophila]|uniref:cupin domain-containing protein n=1 Tax=Pseudonocardia thermophila TaxID=1848 RepID=UPI00248E7178|nr:cupin domain-containing protein [Pseudonocardia thermophila]
MQPVSLTGLSDQQITEARAASAGRTAATLHGGRDHRLKQVLLTLAAGRELADHDNPGEATLLVLRGRVQLGTAGGSAEIAEGEYLVIPAERHHLVALEDATVLLTVVAR